MLVTDKQHNWEPTKISIIDHTKRCVANIYDLCPLVAGRTDYFHVDNRTGEITSLVVLDRDNATMVGEEGVFELTVRVRDLAATAVVYHPECLQVSREREIFCVSTGLLAC